MKISKEPNDKWVEIMDLLHKHINDDFKVSAFLQCPHYKFGSISPLMMLVMQRHTELLKGIKELISSGCLP